MAFWPGNKIIRTIMISKETIKRSLKRVLEVGLIGLAIAFVAIPMDQLLNPKQFGKVILLALLAGFIGGVKKAISGYLKFDKKTK